MSAIAIGGLRRRVTLEAPVDVADGAGGFARGFAPVAQLWARVTPQQGEARFIEERREQRITHLVTIRWRADVASDMRFIDGPEVLMIRAAFDADGSRRFLLCGCEQII